MGVFRTNIVIKTLNVYLARLFDKNKKSYCSHPSVGVGVGVTTYVKVFVIVQIFSKSIDIWL
jgi:hypothetical protein